MEKSTGKRIQTIGSVVATLGVICSIIIAILFWVAAGEAYSDEKAVFVIGGFISLIVGIISSIISGIFVEGFGELVENSETTKSSVRFIERRIEDLSSDLKKQSTYTAPYSSETQSTAVNNTVSNYSTGDIVAQQAQQNNTFASQQNNAMPAKEQEEISQMWKCPNCNNFNFATSNECMNCHTKVKFK